MRATMKSRVYYLLRAQKKRVGEGEKAILLKDDIFGEFFQHICQRHEHI